MTSNGETEGFVNDQGHHIFCKYWKPELPEGQAPRGLVFMCHGYAEHCLYYEPIAKHLNSKGFFVFGHDHDGHGQSGGDHVNISDFNIYVNDVIKHITIIQQRYPDIPTFIVGHSMGGLITVKVLLAKPDLCRGTVLIGPAISSPEINAASALKVSMVKLIGRMLPSLTVATLDSSLISRDPQVVKNYDEDPLVYHGKVKARFTVEFYKATLEVDAKIADMKFPFFILHGEKDGLADIQAAKKMFEKASSTDKKFEEFSDAYHQLHYEIDGIKEKVNDKILSWIEERI